jgi:4-diphosphocytidyl-2C-methyl-D-erythritol kinase
VKGDGPNELARAAQHFDPRVRDFAEKLGAGWRMTGSGSAFFRETAIDDTPDIKVWTTVAHAVGPWS